MSSHPPVCFSFLFFSAVGKRNRCLQLNVFIMRMVAPGGDEPGDEHGSRVGGVSGRKYQQEFYFVVPILERVRTLLFVLSRYPYWNNG